MKFYKMENEENDFVILNTIEEPLPKKIEAVQFGLAISLCKSHHTGIGADGLVLLMPPEDPACDYKMRIFNADGTEPKMCGNACACLGKFVYDFYGKKSFKLETNAGIRTIECSKNGVRVDLGEPVVDGEKDIGIDGKTFHLYCIRISGVPHAITFIDPQECLIEDYDISEIAPQIEKHPAFPNGTNVDFVWSVYEGLSQVKFWERGVGETNACGTGSCAVLVAETLYHGGADRQDFRVEVFPTNTNSSEVGGILNVSWSERNNHVYLNECQPSCRFIGETELHIPASECLRPPDNYAEIKRHGVSDTST